MNETMVKKWNDTLEDILSNVRADNAKLKNMLSEIDNKAIVNENTGLLDMTKFSNFLISAL